MKRAVVVALAAVLGLTGCSYVDAGDPEVMKEIAEARDTCAELGGTFEQWATDLGARWRCNFDETDVSEDAQGSTDD